jgi:hypothetical protein
MALCAGLAGALVVGHVKKGNLPAGVRASGSGTGSRLLAAAACTSAVLVPSILSSRHLEAYSHFLGLIVYKMRYVYKPPDPAALPFDVRAFWVGPFHSPDPLHLFVFALPLLLLLPGPMSRLIRRWKKGDFTAALTGFLLMVFLALFLLMQRMLPFFGAFAVVVAGGLPESIGRVRSAPLKRAAAFTAAAVAALMILQVLFWESGFDLWRRAARSLDIPRRRKFVVYPLERDPERGMIDWISANTGAGDVVLSLHYLSPQILTYTGRPTNLNDFFEAPRLREKAGEMLRSLYSSEKKLLSFCRENGSEWLVLSSAVGCDPSLDSPLYQAGFDHMPPDCAAYRMMFEPAALDSFDLVFENEMYRIFRIGVPPAPRKLPASPLFFRGDLLWRSGGDIAVFYDTVMHMYAVTVHASRLMGRGGDAEAEALLVGILEKAYFHPAWRLLDALLVGRGASRERLALAEYAWASDPWRADVCLAAARCRMEAGDRAGAAEVLEACSGIPMTADEADRFGRLVEKTRMEGGNRE